MRFSPLTGRLSPLPALMAAIFVSTLVSGCAGARVRLAGYTAAYDLSLSHPDASGSVSAVRGRLAVEFADVCHGYTLDQRMIMDITDNDGVTRTNDFAINSWESIDGLRFRFNVHNGLNGQITEEYAGHADLEGPGKPGLVVFTKPERKTLALPAGTIFPSEHVSLLIEAAEKGETFMAERVFDGSGEDGLADAGAAIGKAIAGPVTSQPPYAALKGVKSWPTRIAYFSVKARAETPQYEVGVRLFANGVGGDLLLDYGDFAIRAKLTDLKLARDPGCR